MNDKRHLYRGFHPDENGNIVITLNGEKIRGEWVYGSLLEYKPIFVDKVEYTMVYHNGSGFCYDKVIPETVGQWVTTDKNGDDVFDGDKIQYRFTNNRSLQKGAVRYASKKCYFYVDNGNCAARFDEVYDICLIGN